MGSSIGILLDPVDRSFTKQVHVILCVFVILVQYRKIGYALEITGLEHTMPML